MSGPQIHTDVHWQAAQWVIQLDSGASAAELEAFSQWLKASPMHVEAFLLANAAWAHFDGIDPARSIDVPALLAQSNDVVRHLAPNEKQARSATATNRYSRHWPRYWPWAAGFAALAVSALLVFWGQNATSKPGYATAVGEQRAIKLEDGSLLQLNTSSKVETHLTSSAREVRLLQGEALFTVAHDETRPFTVQVGAVVIQAIGTQFNVYRRPEGTRIAVLEGRVKVTAGSAVEIFNAGEEAQVSPQSIAKRASPDVDSATAWRARRLVFKEETIANIAAEFNRYNASYPIRIEGDAAGRSMRLSGVFRADDPEAVVLYLEGSTDVTVERVPGAGVVIRPR